MPSALQWQLPADVGPFDRQKTLLGRQAAASGEAAEFAASGDNAMTRHHNGEGITGQRLPDLAGGAWIAQPRGDLAIGDGFAGGNGAGNFVDLALERRYALQVQADVG